MPFVPFLTAHPVVVSTTGALASAVLGMTFIGGYLTHFDTQLLYILDYSDLLRFWIVAIGIASIFLVLGMMLVAITSNWRFLSRRMRVLILSFIMGMLFGIQFSPYFFRPMLAVEMIIRIALLAMLATTAFATKVAYDRTDLTQKVALGSAALAGVVISFFLAGAVYGYSVKSNPRNLKTIEFKNGDNHEREERVLLIMINSTYVAFTRSERVELRKVDDMTRIISMGAKPVLPP